MGRQHGPSKELARYHGADELRDSRKRHPPDVMYAAMGGAEGGGIRPLFSWILIPLDVVRRQPGYKNASRPLTPKPSTVCLLEAMPTLCNYRVLVTLNTPRMYITYVCPIGAWEVPSAACAEPVTSLTLYQPKGLVLLYDSRGTGVIPYPKGWLSKGIERKSMRVVCSGSFGQFMLIFPRAMTSL